MSADPVLTHVFAAIPDPADDGFSARVQATIARKERAAEVNRWVHLGLTGLTLVAVPVALSPILAGLAEAGLGVAETRGEPLMVGWFLAQNAVAEAGVPVSASNLLALGLGLVAGAVVAGRRLVRA